ncbi:MAG TPA: GHMP kinase [Pirellulales bacterium]|nr:GHMP kinase [Pirellulales bacterium]
MIITKTPFRISFFGGGTDYPEHFAEHGGAVLGTAIDKCTYLAATPFYSQLFDYSIRLAYRQVECVPSLEAIQHAPFRECLRWVGIHKNIEIDCMASLPSSVGLGTSSSFVVGLLNTLYAFQGRMIHPMELAYQAIEIERDVLGESVGCQDQMLAAVGGFNLLEFRGTRDVVASPVTLSEARLAEFEDHLMLVFTGLRRRASTIAARQVNKVAVNHERLKKMRQQVDQAYDVLAGRKSLARFGELLHEAWIQKRSLDEAVSNPLIDELYQRGLDGGALGGKLLGAGGGGFLLFFVPPERRATVRAALNQAEEIPVKLNAPGTQVIHDDLNRAPANDDSSRAWPEVFSLGHPVARVA